MLAEFVEKLLSLKRDPVVTVHGLPYRTQDMQPIMKQKGNVIEVSTLTGLVHVAALVGGGAQREFLHIRSHEHVDLVEGQQDEWARREVYGRALFENPGKHPFGQWLKTEAFLINLQSMFLPSEDLTAIQQACSHVAAESSVTTEDDGVSQKVTVNRGVAFKENKVLKPIVTLQPYRTFAEIEQPSSKFLFRMRRSSQAEQAMECMLVEADGGLWRQVAMQSIKAWLAQQVPGVTIIC